MDKTERGGLWFKGPSVPGTADRDPGLPDTESFGPDAGVTICLGPPGAGGMVIHDKVGVS